ncbi:hypothetical protein [Bergeyella zoohelcum]|uniref:hypothetical protein n=1 Tax=Bergeyella zoohelcum TaxID=1015 RepID=UPI003736A649
MESKASQLIKQIQQSIEQHKKKEDELKARLLSNFYGYFEVYAKELMRVQIIIGEYERTLKFISVAKTETIEKYLLERRQVILNSILEDNVFGTSSDPFFNLKYMVTFDINRKIALDLYNWINVLKS